MDNQNCMTQLMYLEEMDINLKRADFEIEHIENQHVARARELARFIPLPISGKGSVLYLQDIVEALGALTTLNRAVDIANAVLGYLGIIGGMTNAPVVSSARLPIMIL